jgi:hypothetical protein
VHPEIFREVVSRPLSLRTIAKATPQAVRGSLSARWARRPRGLGASSAGDGAGPDRRSRRGGGVALDELGGG